MEPAEIADFRSIAAVDCPCGQARRSYFGDQAGPCSQHVVHIARNAARHHHRSHTEIYHVLQGSGRIELDGRLYPLEPGVSVLIRPGVHHRAVVEEDESLVILNTVIPPFDPADEWLD